MTGEEFSKIIKDSGIRVDDLVAKSGVTKSTLFRLYKKDYVEKHYLDAIEKAGVDVSFSLKKDQKQNYASPELLLQVIDTMRQAFDILKKDHELYQALVEQGIQDGTLRFTAKKEKV